MSTYQETNAVADSTHEVMKVQYTRQDPYIGRSARGASSHSDDGRLDVKFTSPVVPGTGTNPEQLFAAGWSACFISAMGVVGQQDEGQTPG